MEAIEGIQQGQTRVFKEVTWASVWRMDSKGTK